MSENKENVPKIRFPGFNDAWEQRRLGEHAKYRRGSFPQPYGKKEWYDGDGAMPFVQVVDVTGHLVLVDDTKQKISRLGQPMSVFVPKGRIVVTLQGSIGRVAITQYDAFVDRTLLIFEGYEKPTDEHFWAYTIQQKFEIEKQKAPGGTIKTITKEALTSFDIFLPEYEEQKKIGEFFSQLDNLITLHQRKLDNVKNLKVGLLQKMFPKNGEDFPEVRFPGFTDAWEQREYGEVIDLLSGQDFSPSEYNDTFNGIPYMTGASCIVGNETIVNRWTTVPRCIAEKGDVLLVCKGSGYGAIAVLAQDKAHIARQFMALRNLPNLDKVFNLYLLNSVIENIKKDARGLIAGIARDAVIKQEISIPLLEEQSQIGTFFKQLDNLITLHQRKLKHLQEQKKTLLQQMFV